MACLGSQAGVFARADDAKYVSPSHSKGLSFRFIYNIVDCLCRLPLSGKASGNLAVKDLTSRPKAPDMEFIFAPFVVLDHGFRRTPWGTSGVTFVRSREGRSFLLNGEC